MVSTLTDRQVCYSCLSEQRYRVYNRSYRKIVPIKGPSLAGSTGLYVPSEVGTGFSWKFKIYETRRAIVLLVLGQTRLRKTF